MSRCRRFAVGALGCALALAAQAGSASHRLDDFRHPGAWRVTASDQVQARLRSAGPQGGLCLAYDFGAVSGYAAMRRPLSIDLPAHYRFDLRVRGSGGPNDVQIKLIDASGDNVWWFLRPNQVMPARFTDWSLRQRDLSFAWGPNPDQALRHVASIEVAVAAGKAGGKGEVCLADGRWRATAAPPAHWPEPRASTSTRQPRSGADLALDGDLATAWRTGPAASAWQVDYGAVREFSGLMLRWLPGRRAADYRVDASDDARHWRPVRAVHGATGDVDALWLPDGEARYLRLSLPRRPHGAALAEFTRIEPGAWKTRNDLIAARAALAPPGTYPRSALGQQNYWTLVGVDGGGARSGLISEDGAVEAGAGGFSVEPSLQVAGGPLLTWANVQVQHTLRDGYLPIPSVQWRHPLAQLQVDAAADGPPEAPTLHVRYTVRAPADHTLRGRLMLSVRPWQVNPPQQFLNTPGGVSLIRRLAWRDHLLQVNGHRALRSAQAPDQIDLRPYDAGLAQASGGGSRRPATVDDPQALASAALAYGLDLPAGGTRRIDIELPLSDAAMAALAARAPSDVETEADDAAVFDAVAERWRARLNRVRLTLPADAQPVADTLRSALAQILMSRDGPALQPGTRSYARSWIRDGAMMVEGLLRMDEVDAASAFVDWYGAHLFANGKVPCCVDHRGADPVPENDSSGEFIHAVALLWRHTGDRAGLARREPQVWAAVRYMEHLRQSERSDANRQPGREAFFGLMPASISHEGYSARPMHSYWDDFWALRGYRDAAELLRADGHAADADQIAGWRDEFQAELKASIAVAMAAHRIDYVPGAAELGDFDATSTTVALSPAQADDILPPAWLQATFERYWQQAEARRSGQRAWTDYTPYELRTVGSLLRLGHPERAWAMLDFFFHDQRPAGWNQWAEVVMRDPRERHFLGDMPHAWISSDFLRSALDLFAYERERDHTLVLGAGLRSRWLRARQPFGIAGLDTRHGTLAYALRPDGEGWRFTVAPGLRLPSGGLRLVWPADLPQPIARDEAGQRLAWQSRELVLPADVLDVRLIDPAPQAPPASGAAAGAASPPDPHRLP